MKNHLKKILIITNIITLGLLIWCWCCCSCCFHTENNSTTNDTGSNRVIKGKGGCETCVQTPSTYDFQFNGDDAVKLVANYTADHWEKINNANTGNIKDSRAVWVSISRLKGFIQTIENKASIALPGCCCDLGIRIYFAEYDAALVAQFQAETSGNPLIAERFNVNNENYTDKSTVILIPTYKWETDGKHHDFNPLAAITCNSVQPESTWHAPILALAMNHGGIVPPPYPTRYCPAYMNSGADFMIYGVDFPLLNSPNQHISDPPTNCPD